MGNYYEGILRLWESLESPEDIDKFFNMCVFSMVDGTLNHEESDKLLEKFQEFQPTPINYEKYCRFLDLDPDRAEHKMMCHKYVWGLGDILEPSESSIQSIPKLPSLRNAN
ncbi:MAG TPA: hypothetical protein VGB26_04330 [Nitrospiria bacterium]|jgi:hypothetical protein